MSTKATEVKKILAKNILADGFDPILDLDKSYESWIVDKRDGREYLDMFSMYASGCIGYNHPMILKNRDLLAQVSLFKPTLSDMYTTQYADFLSVFDELAIPKYCFVLSGLRGEICTVLPRLRASSTWY